MIDYLYKFPDETTAQTVLANYYDAENGWKVTGNGWNLDPIGIFVDINATDPENIVSTLLDGWHINLRIWDNRVDPAPGYRVFPSTQRRVWF